MTQPRHPLLARPPLELYERVARYAEFTGRSLSNAAIVLLERGLRSPDTAQESEIHARSASR